MLTWCAYLAYGLAHLRRISKNMKIKLILGLGLLAPVFASGFAQADQKVIIPVSIKGQLTGYSVDTGKGELNISVMSGGCLSKDNFEVNIAEIFPPVISIVQVSIDPCEAMPHPTNLTYTFEELGIGAENAIMVTTKSTLGLSQRKI